MTDLQEGYHPDKILRTRKSNKFASVELDSPKQLDNSHYSTSEDESITYPTFTNEVIVIRPEFFYENTDCQQDNKFMKHSTLQKSSTNELAQKEFDNFKATLENSGIKVMEFLKKESRAPDAIFPDWFTTHKNEDIPEGVFILYPMKHESRQLERDQAIIQELRKNYKHFIDLSHWEHQGLALEGKGSLVFDYRNNKIYCSLSPRASQEVLSDLVQQWNIISRRPYKTVTFTSFDRKGNIIYHTDCMMTLLKNHAVVCLTTVKDKKQRKNLILELCNPPQNKRPYQILEIDRIEVEGMCANMFNLVDNNGRDTVIMSERAKNAYDPEKFEELTNNYKVIVANIDLIEHVGGGSTRCMLAEKF